MKVNKEKLGKVIDELKKEAASEVAATPSAEELFNQQLLEKKSGVVDPFTYGKTMAEGFLAGLEEKQSEEDLKKEAGVNVDLVGSQPGVDQPDPDQPALGKTVTTTNEVEKGLVAKQQTVTVADIIESLTPGKGVGPSTVEVTSPQISLTKMSEIEKAAEQIVSNLFEKYASVETEEEKQNAIETIVKYATAAEEILEANLGDNYTAKDVQDVAERLIDNDILVAEQEEVKNQEAREFGEKVAEAFLAKLDEVGQENLKKQAEAENVFLTKAAELLEKEVGKGNFDNEDIQKVAVALSEKESKKTAADRVLAKL